MKLPLNKNQIIIFVIIVTILIFLLYTGLKSKTPVKWYFDDNNWSPGNNIAFMSKMMNHPFKVCDTVNIKQYTGCTHKEYDGRAVITKTSNPFDKSPGGYAVVTNKPFLGNTKAEPGEMTLIK